MTTTSTTTAPAARRPFPLCTGIAEVASITPITPGMVRLTLAHPALRELPVTEPGEVVTLLWPAPGEPLALPELGWRFPPGVAERQHARNYTVRAWTPGAETIDVDFVLHGDHGLAAAWAAAAQPGDRVGFAGSRMHWVSDVEAEWALLAADETALPALAAIAEALPAGVRGIALVEVDGPGEEQPLPAGLEVHWLHREGREPGATALLADAARALTLPAGPGRAWGGGEARAMRDVRRHLREERGLTSDRTHVLGYWKHARTDGWE